MANRSNRTPQKGQFGDIKTGQVLEVKDGQAEILLTPGVFLRVAENSSFRMISNKLIDTRVEVLSGSVIVGSRRAAAGQRHHCEVSGRARFRLLKKGLYRVDSEPARLRVYDGEARVSAASERADYGRRKATRLISVKRSKRRISTPNRPTHSTTGALAATSTLPKRTSTPPSPPAIRAMGYMGYGWSTGPA